MYSHSAKAFVTEPVYSLNAHMDTLNTGSDTYHKGGLAKKATKKHNQNSCSQMPHRHIKTYWNYFKSYLRLISYSSYTRKNSLSST